MATDHGDELGADRSQRHWRLVSVQAGGGLTVVRQRTRRSIQQLHLAGFLAKYACTVAGIGDTRLGDDITSFTTSVKHAALAEHERAAETVDVSGAGSSRGSRTTRVTRIHTHAIAAFRAAPHRTAKPEPEPK